MLPTLIVQEVDIASGILLCLLVLSLCGAPRFAMRTILHNLENKTLNALSMKFSYSLKWDTRCLQVNTI